MQLDLLLYGVGLVALLEVLRTHHRLAEALGPSAPPERLTRYPSISVIRPIRGLDVGARENLRAALRTGYPGTVETIFVFDDEDEPALPLARAAVAAHEAAGAPGRARVLIAGPPPPGRTGKLHAMIAGLREARGELVAFADSDIRPDERALTVLVETLLGTPGAGAAFAPVLVAQQPRTVGDAGYTLLLNGLYGPAAAAAARRNGGELPFIMGQFMAFKRETLAAIGGLESADGQLVDDMYLGARVKAAGYRNVPTAHSVPIIQEGLPFSDFVRTYVRWITFSRSGLPGWSFKLTNWLHGIVFWAGLLACAAALAMGAVAAAVLTALVPLGVATSINRLHRGLGGAPLRHRHLWVSFGLLVVGPFIIALTHLSREVTWRGRSYPLDAQARLAGGEPGYPGRRQQRPQTA